MANKKNIQSRVADTILQRPIDVKLGGRTFHVAQPTIGTLILVSEQIGSMPDMTFDANDVIKSVVGNAKDCRCLVDICALLILGAKQAGKHTWGIIGQTKQERLAKWLYLHSTPKEIGEVISTILSSLGIGDFFAISTFLQGLNLTKPTKVDKTTARIASGR